MVMTQEQNYSDRLKGKGQPVVFPPKDVTLGHLSFSDPKTETQYLSTMVAGPEDDQINFITTALTGGQELENFTMEVKGGEPMTCLLEQEQDPTSSVFNIGKGPKMSLEFSADGRKYLATIVTNPKNTDLINIHVLRCEEPKKYSLSGSFIRMHHSGWWAAVVIVGIIAAAAVTWHAIDKCVGLDVDVNVKGCTGKIKTHKR